MKTKKVSVGITTDGTIEVMTLDEGDEDEQWNTAELTIGQAEWLHQLLFSFVHRLRSEGVVKLNPPPMFGSIQLIENVEAHSRLMSENSILHEEVQSLKARNANLAAEWQAMASKVERQEKLLVDRQRGLEAAKGDTQFAAIRLLDSEQHVRRLSSKVDAQAVEIDHLKQLARYEEEAVENLKHVEQHRVELLEVVRPLCKIADTHDENSRVPNANVAYVTDSETGEVLLSLRQCQAARDVVTVPRSQR